MKQVQSRRKFIESLTLYTGSTALLSMLPWTSILAGSSDTEKQRFPVKIGVIGTGSRGQLLIRHLKQIPGVQIVAICDDYSPHLIAAMKMVPGAITYTDYRALLDNRQLSAVVVATPLHEHARMSIDAMNAGLHVFCEKSMARTLEQCKDMLLTHRKTGKILQIGHQRLFNIKYLKGYEFIKQGMIGPVTHIQAYWYRNSNWRRPVPDKLFERKLNWRLYDEYSAGLMTELASHQVQVANWFLNEIPESVVGSGSIVYWKDGREAEDNISVVFKYPSGVHLAYQSNLSNKQYGLEERIMGKDGSLEMESRNGRIFSEKPEPAPGIVQLIHDIEKKTFSSIPIGGASWIPETAVENKGKPLVEQYPVPDDVRLQMEAFVESVRRNKPIEGMAEHGYHSGVASLLGFQAIREKKTIYWPNEYKL